MTEYSAYLDVAGHPSDKLFIAIAGFIASEKQWLDFEQPWRDALKKHGLGDCLHMADFESSNKRDRATKDLILYDLIKIVRAHTRAHVFCSMDMIAYKMANELYALDQTMGSPYAIVARTAYGGMKRWKNKHGFKRDKLLMFVERGTQHQGDMEETFRRDGIQVPIQVDKKLPSVQPADLLGWEGYNAFRTRHVRETLNALLGSKEDRKYDSGWDFENLVKSCQRAGVPKRNDIPLDGKIVYHHNKKRIRERFIFNDEAVKIERV